MAVGLVGARLGKRGGQAMTVDQRSARRARLAAQVREQVLQEERQLANMRPGDYSGPAQYKRARTLALHRLRRLQRELAALSDGGLPGDYVQYPMAEERCPVCGGQLVRTATGGRRFCPRCTRWTGPGGGAA